MEKENLIDTLDVETQLRHCKQAITELQLENDQLKKQLNLDFVSKMLPTHVKLEDRIFLEDGHDSAGNLIDGYFTDVYIRKDELKNGGKFD